jgi:hypothetical protein
MHLLAQFREKRAYRPLVTIFRAPGEIPFDLAGDTVTEGLAQILASVYDGDPGPLQQLVEDDSVNEYVRSAAIDAFIVLVRSEQMPREDVLTYYRILFEEKLTRQPSHAWNELVGAVADLPAPELLVNVRRAYADELVETDFADLASIERELLAPERRSTDQYKVITDAIAEMEWWAAFHPEPSAAKARAGVLAKLRNLLPAEPVPVRRVKTGRNDPCPCGSGWKYKKCCGND